MATKKVAGGSKNGRDSHSKRLGIKIFGTNVKPGMIICRQRGSKFKCGSNTFMGSDFTIHAKIYGKVVFKKRFISVVPEIIENNK